MNGGRKRLGFFTTRFVDAPDSRSAELAAVQMIRRDPQLAAVLNERSDPPTISANEATELAQLDREWPNAGYTFYEEDIDGSPLR